MRGNRWARRLAPWASPWIPSVDRDRPNRATAPRAMARSTGAEPRFLRTAVRSSPLWLSRRRRWRRRLRRREKHVSSCFLLLGPDCASGFAKLYALDFQTDRTTPDDRRPHLERPKSPGCVGDTPLARSGGSRWVRWRLLPISAVFRQGPASSRAGPSPPRFPPARCRVPPTRQ